MGESCCFQSIIVVSWPLAKGQKQGRDGWIGFFPSCPLFWMKSPGPFCWRILGNHKACANICPGCCRARANTVRHRSLIVIVTIGYFGSNNSLWCLARNRWGPIGTHAPSACKYRESCKAKSSMKPWRDGPCESRRKLHFFS